jgi:hypothetical protein
MPAENTKDREIQKKYRTLACSYVYDIGCLLQLFYHAFFGAIQQQVLYGSSPSLRVPMCVFKEICCTLTLQSVCNREYRNGSYYF